MVKYKLIKIYPGSPKLGTIEEVEDCFKNLMMGSNGKYLYNISESPEFWELIVEKDYEILFVITNNNKFIEKVYNQDATIEPYWKIHSVKRLSDGEIFTIGDKCSPIGKYRDNIHSITKIWFCNPGYLRLSSNNYTLGIKDIQKVKIPLFTSEDGVDIFEGDTIYMVTLFDYSLSEGIVNNKDFGRNKVRYSTKEKALEWISYNKPLLSINDVWDNLKVKDRESVLKFVKSKLNK